MRALLRLSIVVLALGLGACASYTANTKAGLEAFEHRDFAAADAVYSKGAGKDGVDQLLYLMDRSMVRHNAGQYAESSKDLLAADTLSEIKDYTALGRELASIITNDRITHYKGEEFETVLISTYLAINYALEGKDEDALVECRRVNRKLEKLRSEGGRTYPLNAFAQYLSGALYERDGNWNSAYVDYRKAWDLKPEFTPLRQDLLRGALESGGESEKDRWERALKPSKAEWQEAKNSLKKTGSILVLYQNGAAPEKQESTNWSELPQYRPRHNRYQKAAVYIDGKKLSQTELLYDIEDVAFRNLKEKYATYIAKRAAGVAARFIIANQIEKKTGSQDLGVLAIIFLSIVSRPDLRAWLTLPQNLQMARLRLAPGKYQVSVRPLEGSGNEGPAQDLGIVEIRKPGDVAVVNYRALN